MYRHSDILQRKPLPLKVLKPAQKHPSGWDRGVLMCAPKLLETIAHLYGEAKLKERWLCMDSPQGYGYGRNSIADLHLLGDPRLVEEYLRGPCGTIPFTSLGDGGDFVHPGYFYPLHEQQDHDLILVASWAPFKRHPVLVEAARILAERSRPVRVLLVGSYCAPGHVATIEEAITYEYSIRNKIREHSLDFTIIDNQDVAHLNDDGSTTLGVYSKAQINQFINRAKAGVLVSRVEGNNRFVAECLCANRPVIALSTLLGGTTKYIDHDAGVLADDDPEGVADAIVHVLDRLAQFEPRRSFTSRYGYFNSNSLLREVTMRLLHETDDKLFSAPNYEFLGDLWSMDFYSLLIPTLDY